jgi:hypothetical protein
MIYSRCGWLPDQSKEDGMVGVIRRKKSISPAVIEKIVRDNPRRFCGL